MILHSRIAFLAFVSCSILTPVLSYGQNRVGSDPVEAAPPVALSAPKAKTQTIAVASGATDVASKLKQKIAWDLHEETFAEFQALTREKLGITLHLHYSAMDDSLTEDKLITFQCDDSVEFGKSLEMVLELFNADYVVDGNLVKIISRDEASADEFLNREIFDARPLIQAAAQERIAQYAGDAEPPKLWEINMIVEEELVDMIQQTIRTDSWEDNGGTGTIVSLNGLLVINQSRRQLVSIKSLLEELKSKLIKQ